jgi:trehalose synthase
VPVEPTDPLRFATIVSADEYQAMLVMIEQAGAVLRDRIVWNVNSTAVGGGVAELLRPLVGYCRWAGVDARWVVISGGAEFFAVTKRLHNHLHGFDGGGAVGAGEREVYERTLAANGSALTGIVRPQDVVILHDPQTAGLVEAVRRTGATVIWRCHVGLDEPNDLATGAWAFLRPYIVAADAYVFSRAAFVWDDLGRDKVDVIHPSIDVFSPKNADQRPDQTLAILSVAGVLSGPDRAGGVFERGDGRPARVRHRAEVLEEEPLSAAHRLISQISRWDALKDPLGVIRGFAGHVSPDLAAHLLVAGPSTAAVTDDPEGDRVFREVRDAWLALPREVRRRVHLALLPMDDVEENAAVVNALQRHSEIVVQKSLAEGFGLTVAEAMWKARPVVASRTGGIQDQIVDGVSGLLLSDPRDIRQFGAAVSCLLGNVDRARRMGAAARDRVSHHFLGPHHLGRYFELIQGLITARPLV